MLNTFRNNSQEQLAQCFHDHGSLRVWEIEAWDHGDPKRTVVGLAEGHKRSDVPNS